MPPFSRGDGRILSQLPCRRWASFSSATSPSSRSQPRPPHSALPTNLAPGRPKLPQDSVKTPSTSIFSRFRRFIGHSSTNLLRQYRILDRRIPKPIRYGVSFSYRLGIAFALILPPAIIFRNHFYDVIRVTGPSMSPYINTDFDDRGSTEVHDITKSTDRILLNLYRPNAKLQRGMVVAFRTAHDPEKWAIKRVVALHGDRVFPLPHYPGHEALKGKGLIVPYGHMWVEGDVEDSTKQARSMDSNIYGPVSTGLITGKATHVITSFLSKWTPIDSADFKLPARVQVDAIALANPDEDYQTQEFDQMLHNGKAAEILKVLESKVQQKKQEEEEEEEEGKKGGKEDQINIISTATRGSHREESPEEVASLRFIGMQAQRQLSKEGGDSEEKKLARAMVEAVGEILGN